MKITFNFEFSLFGKSNEKIIVYPRGTKSEAMFPIALWMDLKDGDLIVSRKSGRIRKIKTASKGFIRMESGAVYVGCDRLFFAPFTFIEA